MNDTTITVTPEEKCRTFRLIAVLTFITFPALFLPLQGLLYNQPNMFPMITFVIGSSSLFAWYFFDSTLIGYRRPPLLGAAIILFAILAVPYYFFKSRPVGKVFRDITIAACCLAFQLVISTYTVPESVVIKTSPFASVLEKNVEKKK